MVQSLYSPSLSLSTPQGGRKGLLAGGRGGAIRISALCKNMFNEIPDRLIGVQQLMYIA